MSMQVLLLWIILTYICKAYRMQSVIDSLPEILYRKLLPYMAKMVNPPFTDILKKCLENTVL